MKTKESGSEMESFGDSGQVSPRPNAESFIDLASGMRTATAGGQPAFFPPTLTGGGASPLPVDAEGPLGEADPRIGKYEKIRELGKGGMGVVYLARDERLGRKVAIKLVQNADPQFTARFIQEAQATARCSHENIVVIHDFGEHSGNPFLVLEYLEGQTLSSLLRKEPKLPPRRAAELMASVVRALVCAHGNHIVHRDLKPDNIFLTQSGTVKVLDFGIAKVLQSLQSGNESLAAARGPVSVGRHMLTIGPAGTPLYMSPEQWGGADEIDHRTDIWTSGVILFELLAGVHPLTHWIEACGGNFETVVSWVKRRDVPMSSLSEAAPDVPVDLAKLVDRCLCKSKEQRFQSAEALLRALEPFLPGRPELGGFQLDKGPYAGLRAFQEDDAARFFGRTREVSEMVTRIRDWPLTAAVGASGVGKSSFIRAGVVPALKSSGEDWDILVIRPGRDPLAALAALISPFVTSTPTGGELGGPDGLTLRMKKEVGWFGSELRLSARRTGKRLLLFVDQFEELYTQGSELADRRAFTACLAAAADDATSPVRVVLSVRSDFLGRVAEDPPFMSELAKGLFFLGAPSARGLRDALVQPAEMVGYRFENDAMIDEMLRYLEATPAALPLLQFTAAQLWEGRDAARRLLTDSYYRGLGGIAGALVSHADRVITSLSSDLQVLSRTLFLSLVTPERTRSARSVAELHEAAKDPSQVHALIDHLVESRLLMVQTGGNQGDATVEIVHESLITAWPTLRRWLDESHEDSIFIEQLRAAARQWREKRRDSGLLWGGEMVQELERFRRRYRGDLGETTRAFMDAVFEQRARGTRRRRWALALGSALVAAMLAASAVALVVIRQAQKEAERNAAQATRAGADARRRLNEVEAKERERQRAEALRQQAESQVLAANGKVELSNAELAKKNLELTASLNVAERQRELAQAAESRARDNEQFARRAEESAKDSARELKKALDRERERTNRLLSKLGSLVETLR